MDDDDDFDVNDAQDEPEEPVARQPQEEVMELGSRQKLRDQLQAEVEAFLARGGVIQQVDANVTADPPQKPGNSYGSRPI